MFIQTEKTPNPETLKFLPGKAVTGRGTADFRSSADAAASPLAQALFAIPGVQAVFLGPDFISVTRQADQDWEMLKTRVLAAVMEHFSANRPVMLESTAAPAKKPAADDGDVIAAQIRELLETRVAPAVAMDGGHIEFVRFEDGIAWLHMQGACAGCPSSAITLKSGIENMLRHYIPEVVGVEAVSDDEFYG